MKCLDTTFLIDIVEAPEDAIALARSLEARGIAMATTALNVYEALSGVHSLSNERHRARLLEQYEAALARVAVLPLTDGDARLAAGWAGQLAREGKKLGVDAIVAAIAARNGCDGIVTRNVRHFEVLERLGGPPPVSY